MATDFQQQYEQLDAKHKHLVKKVKEMLEAQQAYFKSNKDFQLLKKSKAIEQEVKDLVYPKPIKQAELEWLGQ